MTAAGSTHDDGGGDVGDNDDNNACADDSGGFRAAAPSRGDTSCLWGHSHPFVSTLKPHTYGKAPTYRIVVGGTLRSVGQDTMRQDEQAEDESDEAEPSDDSIQIIEGLPMTELSVKISVNPRTPSGALKVPKQPTTQRAPRRKVFDNSDIPGWPKTLKPWRTIFIPMLLDHIGTQQSPWGIVGLVEDLQMLWDRVFPDIEHQVAEKDDPVYFVAKQRAAEWRTAFAASALHALEAFFERDAQYDDPEERAAFVKWAQPDPKNPDLQPLFLWKTITGGGDEEIVPRGAFRSILVLVPFATHLQVVAAIPLRSRVKADPRGALVLAAAAAERALAAWSSGVFALPETRTARAFSHANWGESTDSYLKSVNRATERSWTKIIAEAEAVRAHSLRLRGLQADVPDEDAEDADASSASVPLSGREACVDVDSD
ncbi:hypothetical protein BV25DRAFT_1922803 [Artomyces pyxidatus]|uniref:Uncharacterized protein n=1 Tax=Artomyces pyxidatus TaxID=48021 RepID=A0ACB8SED6_9AGAM|nr:hypothetical protein BV25DRAFT_1922803 [Artomyces pyxidatus]